MKLNPTNRTYRHQFKNGIAATLTLPNFSCEWSRKPTMALAKEYFRWRNICIEEFAKETGVRIAVVTPPAI